MNDSYIRNQPLERKLQSQCLTILKREFPFAENIQTSSAYNDIHFATDVNMTINGVQYHVGCRVRRQSYQKKYEGQFTIRCGNRSHLESELSKIKRGYMDALLYGFIDENNVLTHWWLLDMSLFRMYEPDSFYETHHNNDMQATIFRSYFMWSFPSFLIIGTNTK